MMMLNLNNPMGRIGAVVVALTTSVGLKAGKVEANTNILIEEVSPIGVCLGRTANSTYRELGKRFMVEGSNKDEFALRKMQALNDCYKLLSEESDTVGGNYTKGGLWVTPDDQTSVIPPQGLTEEQVKKLWGYNSIFLDKGTPLEVIPFKEQPSIPLEVVPFVEPSSTSTMPAPPSAGK